MKFIITRNIAFNINPFFLMFLASLVVILLKIYIAQSEGFILGLDPFGGTTNNDSLILMPDEITYINWIEQRGQHIYLVMSGERSIFDITNMFGYYPSYLYHILGDWIYTLPIGLLGLFLYYNSLNCLIKRISIERFSKRITFILLVSPGILLLSTGLLRDLYVISFILYLFSYSIDKRYVMMFFFICLIFLTRNFLLFFCLPFLCYFFFYDSKKRKLIVLTASFLLISSMLLVTQLYPPVNSTGLVEVIFRVISAVFFVNSAVFDIASLISEKWLFKLDRLGLISQFIFSMYAYQKMLRLKVKINLIQIAFLSSAISLGILYGHILGFFVFRTRLILFVLFVISFYITISNRRS